MIFSWNPVVIVDIVGSILTLAIAILCFYNSLLWYRQKPNDIFRHYIFLLTLTFVLFAVSRSFGHLLKQLLSYSDLSNVWMIISPYSGSVNTVTFVIVASFSLYFNRLQKVHNEVEEYKSGLERLVEERTRQLEKVNLTLETVLDSANPICLVNLDFEILKANKAYYEYWPEKMADGGVLKCFESRPGSGCRTESCPVNLIGQGMDEVVEQFSKELSNGEMAEFIITARPFRDINDKVVGIVESFQDITVQTHAAKEMLAEREQLNVTLRSIGDGVITTDTDGVIVLINKAAEEVTGWPQAEAVGRQFYEVFDLLDKSPGYKVEDLIVGVGSTSRSAPKKLLKKDGTLVLVSESVALIRDMDSRAIGAVLVFSDVTQKIKTDEELSKVAKLESVGVLAGGIAHDFNNILTAIMGNINLAMIRVGPESEIYKLLSSAEKASARAKNLTQQLLTFSMGGEPIKSIATIQEIIKDSAEFVLCGSNVQCEYAFGEDLWAVEVDTGQISQVIQNIILNGSASMAGGGTITVNCTNHYNDKDTFFLKAGQYVKVSFVDQGVGIPADKIDKIFDPFFTTKKTGSGLGLAISHSIIKNHDGHIEVESKLGVGSTFTFYLPASGEVHQSSAKQELVPNNVEGEGRIMIMDDDDMIRELVGNMLESIGFGAVLARDGEEAIKLYLESKEKDEPIVAIIMDLTIPGGMGGKEAVQEILKIDPEVKVIVASGYSNDPILADYRDYGFSAAMIKPFKLQEMREVVSLVLA
ncbi:MAG: PAS domain S-box protein [Desulfobulbaceae bacterium]|nr:PAS domain S-box protein [Desulfobulbaceae bacterium]